ncbi:amidohydrolase family protein [Actinokineospora enzanensis]|uniref:amidohydrolase family protein n=1 Tax=Actinokineospora enzanensis TaxID=155975 RepID=UPI00036E9DBE|nr:amidohydrolase family protein [Actinokineospora enzanensis]
MSVETIDVHGHVTPPELLKRFPMPPSLGDIAGMIERKAALGIGLTIVGSPVGAGTMLPVPGLDNYAQTVDQLEGFHDWLAETVRTHRDHLRGYVYLNPLATDDSLDRARKRLAQDEFVGLIVNTSVRGKYLDAPEAEGVFALAAETGAPILLHPPAEPVGAAAFGKHVGLVEHVARPCDVTAGVAAILAAGWLATYPDLKLIAPNAGGALALLPEKLDLAHQRAGAAGPRHSEQLRRIYVDSATPNAHAIRAAVDVFGPGHVLFGTDSPPLATPLDRALDLVSGLDSAIRADNARALFGLDGV